MIIPVHSEVLEVRIRKIEMTFTTVNRKRQKQK